MWTTIIIVVLGIALVASIIAYLVNDYRWANVTCKHKICLIDATDQLKQMTATLEAKQVFADSLHFSLGEMTASYLKQKKSCEVKDKELAARTGELLICRADLDTVSAELFAWLFTFAQYGPYPRGSTNGRGMPECDKLQEREEGLKKLIEEMREQKEFHIILSYTQGLVRFSKMAHEDHSEMFRPAEFALNAMMAEGGALTYLKVAVGIYRRKEGGDPDQKLAEMRDRAMLRFLWYLSKRIPVDRERDPSSWSTADASNHALQKYLVSHGELHDLKSLRGILMDLVKHRNEEYMRRLDELPPDIAQYFLRLTVAEPVKT